MTPSAFPLRQASDHRLPLVEELAPAVTAEDVFLRLCRQPHCVFLDSARLQSQLARYSFVACDPFDWIETPAATGKGLAVLSKRLTGFQSQKVPGLPPFQGGAAGVFSFDLGRDFEEIPASRFDEFRFPAIAAGLYDAVVAFDHIENRAWIISHGFPEQDPNRRHDRAARRIRFLNELIRSDSKAPCSQPAERDITRKGVPPKLLAPQWIVDGHSQLSSNFCRDEYLEIVSRAIEYIWAGDIFQVNLAQRLLHPAVDDSISLYLRLRRRNPATFAAFFDAGSFQIASASPERFVSIAAGAVEARPIKGTRARHSSPEADLFTGDDLLQSEKDRAENIMIVDLLRNDLSKVCLPESVRVTQLCKLESYEHVQHLVSAIVGQLQPRLGPLDLIRAAFPGGSITGAPKLRAMEIIAELEPTARGPYCGSLGYLGFDGSMDLNILIRTIIAAGGWWQAPVGGGIVAQSDPGREYEETWEKAAGMIEAMSG